MKYQVILNSNNIKLVLVYKNSKYFLKTIEGTVKANHSAIIYKLDLFHYIFPGNKGNRPVHSVIQTLKRYCVIITDLS